MRDAVIAASAEVEAAFKWIVEVQLDANVKTLADPGQFPSLDMKLGKALTKVAQPHAELFKDIMLSKETIASEGLLFRGRQIYYVVMQRYRTSATQGNIFEFKDLIGVKMRHPKDKKALVDFLHSWDHTRLYMKQAFAPEYDEQLFILQVGFFPGIKDDMRYYNRLNDDIPEEYAKKGYPVLRGYCDDWLALK